MRDQITKRSSNSSLWQQMGNIIAQYDGLIAGYTDHPATEKANLTKFAFQLFNGIGDSITIRDVLNPGELPHWDKMTKGEILAKVGGMGHCSALIKVLPGYENIFAGHSRHFVRRNLYSNKLFHQPVPRTGALTVKSFSGHLVINSSKWMSFASYSGYLVSLDDFYIMDSGLVMIQTTNSVFNSSLLKFVSSNFLLAWHRVRLANVMRHSGKEWSDVYKQFNSGTYNNQYMLLDLKKVELKKTLQNGALWIVEQIPGLVVGSDQTEILRAGYWPSYNVPFHEKIYNLSGYPEFVKKHGLLYSYQLAPRAEIFCRDQGKVIDMASMKRILRYNDFLHDPYSIKNPKRSICSRGDLLIPSVRIPAGCYDTKVTDYSMANDLMTDAISGPTYQTNLTKFAFQLFNGIGDFLTIKDVLNPGELPNWDKMTKDEILAKVGRMGHCSALIKVLPGYENIFAGHSSWFSYSAIMRIYKYYLLNLADPSHVAKRMSFASYAGYLVSLDDFYIMDSGLVMIQTTNNMFNTSLLKFVSSNSLLAWHRVRLANLMAHSGKEWSDIYKQYNSGTYNNQYMLLDLKKVELKKTLQNGALWIVERIPGLVVGSDQTEILRAGYWPSYNVPFHEKIYNLSGYPEFVKTHGLSYSYQLAPRAEIFCRDQGKVIDMASMKRILRYNDFPHDPYSDKNACNSICCRGDLLSPSRRSPPGCYDTKVTDYSMAKDLMADAISGPTYQGLPVFCWSNFSFPNKHVGLPDCYDFDFVTMKPTIKLH